LRHVKNLADFRKFEFASKIW